ncbi:glycosyltransferase [Sphingomonas olei]|uniref:Glycosyltransferase family 4 protein n=1 Tax=Sphingomonas olei TaxID=1886787 RepID=A0ABY2QEM1_9SPHN|nr:glycosyltransferase [Sphingomonas olei]THG38675.1 glycosyltransferase family 4 protein [Sphingomonas olei]
MLRVLTLSSLFPDETRPNFGVFVERQTLGLAAAEDVTVRVVAPVGLPPWPLRRHRHYRAPASLPRAETWKGLHVVRPRFTTWPGTKGRFHVAALIRALAPLLDDMRRDFPFDVIDASFFFPDGPAALAMGRRYDVPVSIKARGADIPFWGTQPATRASVLAAGQGADGLLAVSGAMRDDMVALGMPGDRIRVHHTGVDLERFAPVDRAAAKASIGVDGPLIISVGALIPRKGHDIVVEAMQHVPGATLLIAGSGPEHAALEEVARHAGVAARVRLLGSVPHADLPALIAAADVMALASSSEGLANAWVEALACGTPIVITAAGGAGEVVTDASAGRIVARTPAAFAEGINDLLAASMPVDEVREHAARFTWAANTAALRDHLLGLVASRRRR